jgi:hypothetical protein
VDWPTVVHSYIPHGVLLSDALRDGELLGRQHKCFEIAVGSLHAGSSRHCVPGAARSAESAESWDK